MSLQSLRRHDMLVLLLIVLTVVSACSSRNINSGMGDQVFSRSSTPVEAKVAPPERVEPPEMRLPEPAVVAPPPNPVSSPIELLPTLADVYFDFDQYAIRSDARSTLKATASILKARSSHTVVVEGHCDERGTNAYNLILGERRAQAVKRHLQDLGLAASQLQIASYGKERPVCTEHSDACRQLNRRVHFSRR